MSELKSIDFFLPAGQAGIISPLLWAREVVYVTRNGVGLILRKNEPASGMREVAFKTTGFLAYKLAFSYVTTTNDNIHVIYKE